MTEHTTIQITKAQADELQERRTHDDESYKSVIARLLEGDSSAIDTDELAGRIVDQIGATAGGSESDAEGIAEAVADELNGVEWHVDTEQVSKEVARQLDYTAIADKVSKQVVRELQG